MREYEVALLFHPDLEIDLETPLKKVRDVIAKQEGEIEREESWGKRRLAYPVEKQEFAIYVFMRIQIPPTSISELERNLKITDEVIRHLVVRADELPEESEKESKTSTADKDDKNDKSKTEEKAEEPAAVPAEPAVTAEDTDSSKEA